MDIKEKLKNEIVRLNGLIKESEKIIEQMPESSRANQEFVLNICKKELAALELEYMKL